MASRILELSLNIIPVTKPRNWGLKLVNVLEEKQGFIAAMCLKVNPFTPESDQRQNSPAASQEYYITQYGELDFS